MNNLKVNNEDFNLKIVKSLENNEIIVQIYFLNEYFAKISKECGKLVIEIYASEKYRDRYFSLNKFLKILEEAKSYY